MGCDCNKAREKEEEPHHKETLARCLARSVTAKPVLIVHQKSITASPSSCSTEEFIRVLAEPFSARFSVEAVLREQGQASLLQARHLSTGQPCYVKSLEKDRSRRQLAQKANLSIEAERLCKLDHPMILRTHEAIQDEERYYLVTEPFAGGLLHDHISDSRIKKENIAAHIMYQVFRALAYCHHVGVVHSNLSLQAVVFPEFNAGEHISVKLTCFGEFDAIPTNASIESFKAPEARLTLNEKSDMYSCGIILSRLLDLDLPSSARRHRIERRRSAAGNHRSSSSERSSEVVSLISALLSSTPQNRPTASQCLAHAWILTHIRPPFLKITTFNTCLYNLRKLRNRNPLQQAILKFIVTRIMKDKELEKYVHIFYALDKDADGTINEEELLLNFVKIMPEAEAAAVTRRVMEAADYNGNGVISFTEFLISCLGEKKLLSPDNLQTAFRCFDLTGSGNVPVHEMRNFFFVRGTAEKERQWRELLIQADRSGDNHIDFVEFTALLTDVGTV